MIVEKHFQALIDIGKILEARSSKLFLSKKYKELYKNIQNEVESAKKDLSIFGMYEDCGSSYEAWYENAKGKMEASRESLSLLISFEKHLKKLKHEFKEKHPEYIDLLNLHLDKQTEQMEKEYRGVA